MTGELVIFFLVVMAAISAGGYLFLSKQATAAQTPANEILETGELPVAKAFFAQTFHAVGKLLPASKEARNPIRNRLVAAGYRHPSALPIFYGIKCSFAICCALIFAWIGQHTQGAPAGALMPLVAGVGLGFLVPDRGLAWLVKRRGDRLRRALPAALDLLVLCIEAGQSIDSSMSDASRQLRHAYPDLATELGLVHLELLASKSRTEALGGLASRNNVPEVRKLVGVLLDCDRFGASLAPALRNHATYLRTRIRQQTQETARKISVKLVFPVFFLIFPSVLLVTLGPAAIQVYDQLRPLLAGAP